MTEKNEAAERLLTYADARGIRPMVDAALAAERRATVERIEDRLTGFVDLPGPLPGKRDLRNLIVRILDEEAALIDEALAAERAIAYTEGIAKGYAEGSRATVERIRARLGGYPILSNDTLRRILDEETAR